MKLSDHAASTEKNVGIKALDIHKWIDGYFDADNFKHYVTEKKAPKGFDPYNHRQFRHCKEALDDAYKEFEHKYTRSQVKAVFEQHLKDDYDGYIPSKTDYIGDSFHQKYHAQKDSAEQDVILDKNELSKYFQGKAYSKQKALKEKSYFFLFKIGIPTVLAVILFIIAFFLLVVPSLEETVITRKKEMIKELTTSAASVVEQYIKLEENGELNRKDAQVLAAKHIRYMRYGPEKKDYFWVIDTAPKMIVHPYKQALEGQDLTAYRDQNNANIFIASRDLVQKSGEGYLEYLWQWKDNPGRISKKLSYVMTIQKWGWIIGTGLYLDDVEVQMNAVINKFVKTTAIISMIIIVILGYIIYQSYLIEMRRRLAKNGLIEAKNRYRALVESANEGFIIEINKKHIYWNHAFQRMVHYDDQALSSVNIWERLLPDTSVNTNIKAHFKELFIKDLPAKEFEAQIKTVDGGMVDVMIATSKVFLAEENGHLITIRKITNFKNAAVPFVSTHEYNMVMTPDQLLEAMRSSNSFGHVVLMLNKAPAILKEMLNKGEPIPTLRRFVWNVFHQVVIKSFAFVLDEVGHPDMLFTFIVFGSNARQEMTMFSDQDCGLIFDLKPNQDLEEARAIFLTIGKQVTDKLNQAGYPFCEGGVMAVNPEWCLSVDEWKELYQSCIESPFENKLKTDIIFDVKSMYGKDSLLTSIRQYVQKLLSKNADFIQTYARHSLSFKVPSTWVWAIKQDHLVNIKECLRIINNFARVYALNHNIEAISTVRRLEALVQAGVLKEDLASKVITGFDHLWRLRFLNQIVTHSKLKVLTNKLNLEDLNAKDRKKLKQIIETLSLLQNKINFDFFGGRYLD